MYKRVKSVLDDIDLESPDENNPRQHRRSKVFDLQMTSQKAWKLLDSINTFICQEKAEFVIANKPIFDSQKLVLIQIDNFSEGDICCGTYSTFKPRKVYTGPVLSFHTFSDEWNQVAKKINSLLEDINATIEAEKVIENVRSKPKANITSSPKQPLFVTTRKLLMILIGFFALVGFCGTMFFVGYEVNGNAYYNQVTVASEDDIVPLIALVRNGTPEAKSDAAEALKKLAYYTNNQVTIVEEGGIVPLIALVRDGTAEGKSAAAGALSNLAANDGNIAAIAKEGGIVPLIALVRNGTAEGKSIAAGAIANLALNARNKVMITRKGGIVPLIDLVRDGTAEGKSIAAGAIANLALNDRNKVMIAREGGIVPLIGLVRDGTAEGKGNAAKALCNLASNYNNQVAIVKEGGIVPLIALVRDGNAEGKNNAVGALLVLATNDANKVTIARKGLKDIERAYQLDNISDAKKLLSKLK